MTVKYRRVDSPEGAKMLPGVSSVVPELVVVGLLLIWGLFLRLPFFFPAVLDWDESTFILMGQGILDGLLPYDTLWELKPPLVFVFFAAAISLFGHTIVAIRVAGYVWITVAAYLTYRSAYAVTSQTRASILAAVLFITMLSELSPEVMTESLALLPLIGALLLLLTTERTMTTCFFAGVFMGTAGMFRTNLAYLAVLVGLYIVLYPPMVGITRSIARGFIYVAGGMTVILITAIPYIVGHRLDLWLENVFWVPLKYSEYQRSLANAWALALEAFGVGVPDFSLSVFLLGCVLWIGGLYGTWLCFSRWRELSQPAKNRAVVVLIFLLGSTASVFLTGPAYSHFLVQLIPWFAIFAAFALARQPANRRLVVELSAFLLMILSTVLFVSPEYLALAQRIKQNESLSHGLAYKIADYLRHENPDRKPVYMLDNHIVYWFIGQYPLTRLSTHPSNIAKYKGWTTAVEGPRTTAEGEMRRILSKEPEFIVKPKKVWYLEEGEEATRLLTETLNRDYVLANVIGGREIYRRKADH
jgi:hypothetical protein